MTRINVSAVRQDTPGCCCTSPRIHLNNAGASLSPSSVVDAVSAHLALEQQIGGYEAAASQSVAVDSVYSDLALLVNASPDEISCSENATRAWWLAFSSIAAVRARPHSIVLAASTEYGSNELALIQVARRVGATVQFLEDDEFGAVDTDKLATRLAERPARDFICVCLAWIGTNGGLIQPASTVGDVCATAGVPFLLDACQAVGQVDVDVSILKCDALAATGRKFLRGPRGIGFLYIKRDGHLANVEPSMLDIRGATLTNDGDGYTLALGSPRWECWERSYALWLGLGAAARYAREIGMGLIEARVLNLGETLREALESIKDVTVLDRGKRGSRCGIVSFRVKGHDSAEVAAEIAKRGVNVSISQSSSTRRDMTQRGISDIIRASVHYFNTEEEIMQFAAVVMCVSNKH